MVELALARGAGRQPAAMRSVLLCAALVLAVGVLTACRREGAGYGFGAAPSEFFDGQTWPGVTAMPDATDGGLEGTVTKHSIKAGGKVWWECGSPSSSSPSSSHSSGISSSLEPSRSYQGTLTIFSLETQGRVTSRDTVLFDSGDLRVRFSPLPFSSAFNIAAAGWTPGMPVMFGKCG